MPRARHEQPSVATFGDHEVIRPPNKLRKTLSTISDADVEDDPVARAEVALANLSAEFESWMVAECRRLDAARTEVKAKGLTETSRQALFHAAHDIKGEAATFGFPAIAGVAASLCRLLEHTRELPRIPMALVDQHVDAVSAILRERSRPDGAAIAEELARRLYEVTDDFLASSQREQPDDLDDIFGPGLVPGDPSS